MAQDAPARLDAARSHVGDLGGGLEIALHLSSPAPYRLFLLDAPERLVAEFQGLDLGDPGAGMLSGENASGLHVEAGRGGWSRLVVALAHPMAVAEAGLVVDPVDRTAFLRIETEAVSREAFVADTAPEELPGPAPTEAVRARGPVVVAIDPGHGGVDPGAMRDGLTEADLMLALGHELAQALAGRKNLRAVLTREADVFVPLAERISVARAAGADVLISLHADALEGGGAAGASVYTLPRDAADEAGERMAARHQRGDLIAGLDLRGADDTVAAVLLDLARLETAPQAQRLAEGLVTALGDAGAPLNTRPLRQAPLAVLTAADFPSVLVEAGFLSNDADRARLATPAGRAPFVHGLVTGIERWAEDEAARQALVRR